MSQLQLRTSLALWRRRHAYRQRKLDIAHDKNDKAGIDKWYKLLVEAGQKIRRRESQLKPGVKVGWMPNVRVLERRSAGSWATDCPAKGVLHTTEGTSDATGTLDANGDHPHFQVERNGRITQYISVFQAAKALEHPAGTVHTNRAHALQIEVVGFARQPDWPGAQVLAVKRVMRFIEANADVSRSSSVPFLLGNRMSSNKWLTYKGWCGHMHVVNNDHVDPGKINIEELL